MVGQRESSANQLIDKLTFAVALRVICRRGETVRDRIVAADPLGEAAHAPAGNVLQRGRGQHSA